MSQKGLESLLVGGPLLLALVCCSAPETAVGTPHEQAVRIWEANMASASVLVELAYEDVDYDELERLDAFFFRVTGGGGANGGLAGRRSRNTGRPAGTWPAT